MYVINKPFVNYKDINEYFAAQIFRLNAGEWFYQGLQCLPR